MMYERPAGYTPDNPEAGSGWSNRLGEAQRLAGAPAAPAAMLQPSVLPGAPSPLAGAFMTTPPDNEIARRQAVASAQQHEARKALLGGGGLSQLFA